MYKFQESYFALNLQVYASAKYMSNLSRNKKK